MGSFGFVGAIYIVAVWSYSQDSNEILNFIGATNHIADQDIWEFMFNSNDPEVKFANVQDYANGLIYSGYVRAYFERADLRELAMYDVSVFTGEAEKLYNVPYMYLARTVTDITLEFPVKEEQNDEARWWAVKL